MLHQEKGNSFPNGRRATHGPALFPVSLLIVHSAAAAFLIKSVSSVHLTLDRRQPRLGVATSQLARPNLYVSVQTDTFGQADTIKHQKRRGDLNPLTY
jgi:hypothetical protein